MAKKYLSIEEAAQLLGLDPKELNRLREKGEIRAFADRGTWKFRHDEIEELSRSLHADSDPDVPIGDYRQYDKAVRKGQADLDEVLSSSSEVEFVDESKLPPGDSTVVRRNPMEDRSSDSDVRLIADAKPDSGTKKGGAAAPISGDSDSDVRLTSDADDEDDGGSDSDVKMVDVESQSSIRLVKSPVEEPDAGSDSDVQLTTSRDSSPALSDSSVRLVSAGNETKRKTTEYDERDSDVTLFKKPPSKVKGGDSSKTLGKGDKAAEQPAPAAKAEEEGRFSLDAVPLAEDGSFILGRDDSGISLAEPADSGIGLHVGDSGIELEDSDDSGITLEGGDSGIALETGTSSHILASSHDSGIALEGDGSGISLDPDESGITLEAGDSGISLETGDSGIALDSGSGVGVDDDSSSHYSLSGDSGIALEPLEPKKPEPKKPAQKGKPAKGKAKQEEDEDLLDEDPMGGGTIPMMSTYESKEEVDMQQTQMEVPFQTGDDEDSDFDFSAQSIAEDDSSDTANVINFADEEDDAEIPLKLKKSSTQDEEDVLDDAVFDVGEGDSDEEGSSTYAVEVASDEELEEMEDVFGAADEDFDEGLQTGESHSDFAAPVPGRMAAPADVDWGTGTLVGLVTSTVLLAMTGMIAYDLVRSMWSGNDPSAPSNFVLSTFRGIFG